DVDLDVPSDAEPLRNGASRVNLARVPLSVSDGQRVETKSLRPGNGRGCVGVQTTAEKYDCVAHMCGVRPLPGSSHAARVGTPDVLVELQLDADGQAIGEHPF